MQTPHGKPAAHQVAVIEEVVKPKLKIVQSSAVAPTADSALALRPVQTTLKITSDSRIGTGIIGSKCPWYIMKIIQDYTNDDGW